MSVDRLAEREIAALARRQQGAVTTAQLRAAGLSSAAILHRADRGYLHRLHQGVYAVGDPALLPLVKHAAALLAIGDQACVSHRSAAVLWGLVEMEPEMVDVTVAGRWPRGRDGIRIHRARYLDPRDVARKHNLRVTAPAHTLIDFAVVALLSELEHALSEARALRLVSDAKLRSALARVPANDHGAATLRALLNRLVGRTITRSELERTFLRVVEATELPEPQVNVWLHGYLVDFFWPAHRLALEVDGYGVHGGRPAFERDRKRDQVLAAAGIQVVRATWLQMEHTPYAVAVRVAQALVARAA
jgi:very-short-patch-repair endonuclease/predicted transcriptional regulator of viral defense system